MAFVAFDIPPATAPKTSRSAPSTVSTAAVATRRSGFQTQPRFAITTRIVAAIAALFILSTIAWNVAVETDSILIGLGAADITFLIAVSFGLSLRSASRSARPSVSSSPRGRQQP